MGHLDSRRPRVKLGKRANVEMRMMERKKDAATATPLLLNLDYFTKQIWN